MNVSRKDGHPHQRFSHSYSLHRVPHVSLTRPMYHMISRNACPGVSSILLTLSNLRLRPHASMVSNNVAVAPFSVSSSGKLGQDLTWEFFQANFERIQSMLAKASPSLMDAVILYCCGGFTEESKMEEASPNPPLYPPPPPPNVFGPNDDECRLTVCCGDDLSTTFRQNACRSSAILIRRVGRRLHGVPGYF